MENLRQYAIVWWYLPDKLAAHRVECVNVADDMQQKGESWMTW